KLIEKEYQKNLKDAIRKLSFDYPLSALDYINADKINSNDYFLLDDEIVETVRPNPNTDNLQDEEIIPVISLTEALVNIENLINLHNFSLENFEVTNEELRILKGIRHKVLRYKSETSIQLNMYEFI
ncbi:20689_t:CDS:1, partial [Funneliformis geosporum]